MPKQPTYSLNRECTDSRSVVMHTSSLGGVIGFGTAFSTLIEPGTMPDVSWGLFQSLTFISFMGMGLGAGVGLAIATYFAGFVVQKYSKKTSEIALAQSGVKQVQARDASKRKNVFGVENVAYGSY